jgi:hypothetical protein
LAQEKFNLHEAVPEYEKFKFFIDFDYMNINGPIDVDNVKQLLDAEVGSTSLMARNIRTYKTGLHLVYPEILVTADEAIQLVKRMNNPYIDPIPYRRSIRTIYSSKDYGEADYYTPDEGGRDPETMIRYSIFTLQSPSESSVCESE